MKTSILEETHGWRVEHCSLYDEEGVDGIKWIAPDGWEHCEFGDTIPEDAPEEVIDYFHKINSNHLYSYTVEVLSFPIRSTKQ